MLQPEMIIEMQIQQGAIHIEKHSFNGIPGQGVSCFHCGSLIVSMLVVKGAQYIRSLNDIRQPASRQGIAYDTEKFP
jgi:hypothetical protein